MSTEIKKLSEELHKKGVEYFLAAKAGDVQKLQALLEEGVPVDSKFTEYLVWNRPFASGGGRMVFTTWYRAGATALMISAYHGQLEAVELLLENGADVNITDEVLHTPLIASVSGMHANPKLVRLLLQKGANIRAEYQNKEFLQNAFHIAADHQQAEIMEIMLAALLNEPETQDLLKDIERLKISIKHQEKDILQKKSEKHAEKHMEIQVKAREELEKIKTDLDGKEKLLAKRLAVLNTRDRTRSDGRKTPLGYALDGNYYENWEVSDFSRLGDYGFAFDRSLVGLKKREEITRLLLKSRADIDSICDESHAPKHLNAVIQSEISYRLEHEFYKRTGKLYASESDLEQLNAIRAELVRPLVNSLPAVTHHNILMQAYASLCQSLPFTVDVIEIIAGYLRGTSYNPELQDDLERLTHQRLLQFSNPSSDAITIKDRDDKNSCEKTHSPSQDPSTPIKSQYS